MKKVFIILLILAFMLCRCQNISDESSGDKWDVRPMICINDIYYVDPYIPATKLPEEYEYAGVLSEKQAYNTGLEGVEYYTNPKTDDFYTYHMTGTYIGNNTVDTTKQAMHYVQWIPKKEEKNINRSKQKNPVLIFEHGIFLSHFFTHKDNSAAAMKTAFFIKFLIFKVRHKNRFADSHSF